MLSFTKGISIIREFKYKGRRNRNVDLLKHPVYIFLFIANINIYHGVFNFFLIKIEVAR